MNYLRRMLGEKEVEDNDPVRTTFAEGMVRAAMFTEMLIVTD